MRFLLAVIIFVMALAIIVFAVNNVGTTVPVTLISTHPDLELIVVVFCSVAFGAIFVGIVAITEGAATRFENRRLRREVHKLDTELNFLRTEPRARHDPAPSPAAPAGDSRGGAPAPEPPSAPVYDSPGDAEPTDPDDDMYAGGSAV